VNIPRKQGFKKWWNKNHHHVNSHMWLTKATARILHNYNTPPEAYSHSKTILKRFNLSAYKRLTKLDAEFLWRLTHPSTADRHLRLLATATFLQEKAELAKRKFSK